MAKQKKKKRAGVKKKRTSSEYQKETAEFIRKFHEDVSRMRAKIRKKHT